MKKKEIGMKSGGRGITKKIVVLVLLVTMNFTAAMLLRHEDRILKAMRIIEADQNAEDYVQTIDEFAASEQWMKLYAFSELHELRNSRDERYDSYRELLQKCSEYGHDVEESASQNGGIQE